MRDVPGIETANQGRIVEAAYSPFNCRSACLQRLIWERCRCLDLGLQHPFFKPSLFCGAFGENITNAKMFFDAEKYKRGHCLDWENYSLDSEECSFLHNIVDRLENKPKGLCHCQLVIVIPQEGCVEWARWSFFDSSIVGSLHVWFYRPQSEGDNALGSIRLSVRLFVLWLMVVPFDLQPTQDHFRTICRPLLTMKKPKKKWPYPILLIIMTLTWKYDVWILKSMSC